MIEFNKMSKILKTNYNKLAQIIVTNKVANNKIFYKLYQSALVGVVQKYLHYYFIVIYIDKRVEYITHTHIYFTF